MTRDDALDILHGWTRSEALLRHARSVELVMRRLADRFGEDPDLFGLAGLLHDADYESFPDEHPNRIVALLRERGEPELAHAISAHYTKWGVPCRTTLDRSLVAADELTGFVSAACLVRPTGLDGMTAKSVVKKLKDKAFARKVERDEIRAGCDMLGLDLREMIELVIETLREHREELGLPG